MTKIADGWYSEMTDRDYHASDALGSGSVKKLYENPAEYAYEKRLPDWVKPDSTSAMEMGTLIHQAVLEPEKFEREVVLMPQPFDRRTKAYKDLAEQYADKNLVVGRDAFHLKEILDNCRKDEMVQRIVAAKGSVELPGFWTDPVTGVSCKCKPDKLMTEEGWIIDIKTVEDANPRKIQRTAVDYLWPIQASHYLNGTRLLSPTIEWCKFVFLIIQRKPPYTVSVFVCSDELIEIGTGMAQKAYASCAQMNHVINNPDAGIRTLELPQWFYNEVNNG